MVNVWLGLGAPICQLKTSDDASMKTGGVGRTVSVTDTTAGGPGPASGVMVMVPLYVLGARTPTTDGLTCTVRIPGETKVLCNGRIQLPPLVDAVAVHWMPVVLLRVRFCWDG